MKHPSSKNYNCKISSRSKIELKDSCSFEEALNCEYLVFVLPAQVASSWMKRYFNFNRR